MRTVDLIQKKRDGGELAKQEIDFLIQGYTCGEIPDYQMAAFCMAVYFNGMSDREISDLTASMVDSGDRLIFPTIEKFIADKHSTGGVGDKTSLVLAPLVASAGLVMAKLSGRGLGHTGGTVDKLEAIPGFRTDLTPDEFINCLKRSGLAIVDKLGNLAPADKKLYALRDVTATVDSIPLIAASVMSKKLSVDSDAIVLDVKVGSGAFMRTLESARLLAEKMVAIGRRLDRKISVLITDMSQPLGYMVGNALEVAEAIATLNGEGPDDLRELCLNLGAELLVSAGQAENIAEAIEQLEVRLQEGAALRKFVEMVENQSGDVSVVNDPGKFLKARKTIAIESPQSGYVTQIDALAIGEAANLLGAGRTVKEDTIDPAVGVQLHAKVGDQVAQGESLATLHMNDETDRSAAEARVNNAFQLDDECPPKRRLIIDRIR